MLNEVHQAVDEFATEENEKEGKKIADAKRLKK
jgi:hypothetical protein